MSLPQSIPDLPNKIEQRKQWELDNAAAGKAGAKKFIGWAKYSPLAFVVPFVNMILDALPDSWLKSADGRPEEEFHYYTPKALAFNADAWERIEGDVWYFTRRGDRFCDLAWTYGDRSNHVADMINLYNAQSLEWQQALPWRVTLWPDSELPGNFPLRFPEYLVTPTMQTKGLSFTSEGHGIAVKPGLNIDAPAYVEPKKPTTRQGRVKPRPKAASGPAPDRAPKAPGKADQDSAGSGGIAIVLALAGLAFILSRRT